MNTILNKGARMLSKAALVTAVLGGFLLFVGAQNAMANDGDDYNRHASYSDWRHDRHEARERMERRREEWRQHERREHRRDFNDRNYRR
jgi:hypothetical protein